jgi:hypothetical protein
MEVTFVSSDTMHLIAYTPVDAQVLSVSNLQSIKRGLIEH